MKGVESRPDQRGVSLPCPDPEDGPGVEDATRGAPEGERADRKGTRRRKVPTEMVRLSALRPSKGPIVPSLLGTRDR